MSEKPRASAFAVCLIFGDGPVFVNALIAPDAIGAAAILAVDAARDPRSAGYNITGSIVCPLTVEWLRKALVACETGAPGKLVSLVQPHDPMPAS